MIRGLRPRRNNADGEVPQANRSSYQKYERAKKQSIGQFSRVSGTLHEQIVDDEQISIMKTNNDKAGLDALLTQENSVLLLIRHQPFQFANLNSHEPTMIVNNVIGLAKTAKVFGVPTILTAVVEERGGFLIKGLQDVFPDQKPIDRTF